jgi:4a-hydroxytetrahydrobiopterin dehydratase
LSDRLHGAARKAALAELHGWRELPDADAIHKRFHFGAFREAWGFASQVALIAERHDHHPEMLIAFDRVEVRLASHDVESANDPAQTGALTERDVALARRIDAAAPERDAPTAV